MEATIYKLGDYDSNLTSYDSENSSGNSHLKLHNRPTSFTGPNKFKIDRGDPVKIPGVAKPKGVVLHVGYPNHNSILVYRKIPSINLKQDSQDGFPPKCFPLCFYTADIENIVLRKHTKHHVQYATHQK